MPKKILVIDSASYVQQFSQALSAEGYLVFSATPEQDVIPFIHQEAPDLVIIDAFYHYKSAIHTISYLIKSNFPFLLFSDDEQIESLIKSDALGALSFLIKPITDKQIKLAIERTLFWHKERLQLNRRTESLNTTVNNNRKISVAIGLLMERYRLSNASAFEVLRTTARNQQCRILDIAIKLINNFESHLQNQANTDHSNVDMQTINDSVLVDLKNLYAGNS